MVKQICKYTIIDSNGTIVNEFNCIIEQHYQENTKPISLKYVDKEVNKELYGVIK